MAWSKLSRQARGYGAAWTKTRALIMARDMHLCQVCAKAGRVIPASQVDHIQPKAKGGTDDHDNLAAICTPCHDLKSRREAVDGRSKRRAIGADGWPVA